MIFSLRSEGRSEGLFVTYSERQFIATGYRRLVTPKGSDCKGILPKMAETFKDL